MKQQGTQASQVTKIFKTFFKDSEAKLTRSKREQKLIGLCKGGRSAQFLLNLLSKSLNSCQQASLRLNIVTLVPSVLFSLDLKLFFSQINMILCDYEQKINKSLVGIASYQKTEHYLRANVELPFIRFLKKGLRWRIQQSTTEDLYQIDQGFSYLNKVKTAFQLKIIFHNFSCYYPQHYYALEMFRVTLLLISKWWNSICDIGKVIIKKSINNQTVRDEDYLFLQEADRTQDLLVDYVTVGSFAKKLQRNFKLKHINFIPTAILQLHNPLKIKKAEKQILQESKKIKETDEDQMSIFQGSQEDKNSGKNSRKDFLESIVTLSSIVQEEH